MKSAVDSDINNGVVCAKLETEREKPAGLSHTHSTVVR